MKLLSGILGLTLTSVVALASANAADMYVAPAPGGYKDVPVPYVSWAGFYLGAHVGGVWGTDKVTDVDGDWGNFVRGASFNNNTSAVFGGGQLGYNFQRGNFVFGPEVDLGFMDLNHTIGQPVTPTDATSAVKPGFYADVTGRLGYSVDRALLYAKGGYAYYGGNIDNFSESAAVTHLSASGMSGWTVGAGVEYKISPVWSLKAEYQHFDFGSLTNTFSDHSVACGAAPSLCSYKNELTADSVKVGVNYFVNSAYVPLK
jgi:outer membrane immunogenic protein